eukprot:CAMPEP_0204192958 /NCGR_PEP_ID=MMETSP0361-20130328/61296_1 /ASSEMBLY_ACC=CAM_ASM_000343 /TAXON_ID=268821 /ORGANISM="Scrippsiella Hangoei, Strain SHTV-5" /LENGTH=502 /DNA_ID=CAMNT_0051154105 /DNA_START=1 /DNA_END=1509 /DNA_ORIENTATION=+
MMANPGTRVGVSILVNRKKNGVLFVNECLVLCLRLPAMNWSYCVGFQRDISKEVPLHALLSAATSDRAYSSFIESRGAALNARKTTLLGVGSENAVRCLHEKAMDVFSQDIWRTARSDMLLSAGSTSTGHSAQEPAPMTPTSSSVMLHRHQRQSCTTSAHRTALSTVSSASTRTNTSAAIVSNFRPPHIMTSCAPTSGSQVMAEPPSPYWVPTDLEASEEMVAFLSSAGLRSFVEPLLRSGFDDMETLLDMTEDDMKDMGLPVGYAKKLKRQLNAYTGTLQLWGDSSDARSPGRTPLAKEKTAVQASWERIQEMGVERFGEILFGELFRMEPMTKKLFTAQVCEKYADWAGGSAKAGLVPELFAKVINVIGGAVLGLHNARRLVPSLVQMGARHAQYGVKPEHLEILGQALLVALHEVLGDTFTNDVLLAWSVVYSFIAASMIAGIEATTSLAKISSAITHGGAEAFPEEFVDEAQSESTLPTLLTAPYTGAWLRCTDQESR